MLSDIENRQRMINELSDRVANLEALCDNPEVTNSHEDVQSRYNIILSKVRVRFWVPLKCPLNSLYIL